MAAEERRAEKEAERARLGEGEASLTAQLAEARAHEQELQVKEKNLI